METFNISPLWMEKLSSFKDKTYNNEEMSRKMDYVFSPDGHKNTKSLSEKLVIHVEKSQ
jgi:hypothetical protein